MSQSQEASPEVVLIGAGIMSATLAFLLRTVQPDWTIHIFERLAEAAGESSDAWNNAGTGHSAFCELNYTPQKDDGSIDLSKAIKIAGQFERSKEMWASLVEAGHIEDPSTFIHRVPHLSFVQGDADVSFLKQRFQGLKEHHLFEDMQFVDSFAAVSDWIPLMTEKRDPNEDLAATKMEIGTDVNFGALTRQMLDSLAQQENFEIFYEHEIRDLDRLENGHWHVSVKNLKDGNKRWLNTPFVFIGAGGGSLKLLEKSDIPEAEGFGGFPVSGQWLVCNNRNVVEKHWAKVYGKAAVGAPPMSVPHLDTRIINQKRCLLFGPYAGFSTRFLKHGSLMDLASSITIDNVAPMLAAGWQNLSLTKYLLEQVTQSAEDRLETLREFVPSARLEDWKLETAGQRVQVIKKDKELGGILEFGTEVVCSADGSMAALLGASPGASTSVAVMLEVLGRCFPNHLKEPSWQKALKKLMPSYGQAISQQRELALETRARSTQLLKL